MAIITKTICDRCEQEFEPIKVAEDVNTWKIELEWTGHYICNAIPIDLCKNCREKLEIWLKELKNIKE